MSHKVYIEFVKYVANGMSWRTHYNGSVLVPETLDPEYSSCRALVKLGLTGRVDFYGPSKHTRTPIKRSTIERLEGGAKWRVDDGNRGPRLRKYVPFDKSKLRKP